MVGQCLSAIDLNHWNCISMKSELREALGEEVFDCLDRFFCIASAHGVRSVTLDCVCRKVHVELHPQAECEKGGPEGYLRSLMEAYKSDKASATVALWKRQQFVEPTVALYQKFIGKQLEIVLKSSFIVLDEWLPTDNYSKYAEELLQWELAGRNYELSYCLLRQLMKLDGGRFVVDEAVTGRYLELRSEKLTQESIQCFFCFVQLCELVYAEMDRLADTQEVLSEADQKLLARLLGYAERCDWQCPATCENVQAFIKEMFKLKAFREFFKGGRAGEDTDRVEVSMANIVGYMMSCQLLAGGQKQISTELFGHDSQVNNINKGKSGEGSQAFKNLIPLMDKYRVRVIGE